MFVSNHCEKKEVVYIFLFLVKFLGLLRANMRSNNATYAVQAGVVKNKDDLL